MALAALVEAAEAEEEAAVLEAVADQVEVEAAEAPQEELLPHQRQDSSSPCLRHTPTATSWIT